MYLHTEKSTPVHYIRLHSMYVKIIYLYYMIATWKYIENTIIILVYVQS